KRFRAAEPARTGTTGRAVAPVAGDAPYTPLRGNLPGLPRHPVYRRWLSCVQPENHFHRTYILKLLWLMEMKKRVPAGVGARMEFALTGRKGFGKNSRSMSEDTVYKRTAPRADGDPLREGVPHAGYLGTRRIGP